MAATAVSAPPSAGSSSRLLITPYTPPRDVLVWNRLEKSWLRIDFGNEREPTGEWLRGAVARQLGVDGYLAHVFAGSESKQMSAADLKRPIDYFTFDGYLSFACSSGKGSTMPIYVKTLSGKIATLDVRSSDLIADVKLKLEAAKDGIPAAQQRLSFADAQLDDWRTLADHSIGQESMLHLALNMRGGSSAEPRMFVDMANEAGMQRCEWDDSAPMWCAVGRGLNLEGICTNSDCEAYEEMVVMPMRFGIFDVMLDSNDKTTRCPCCKTFVHPLTCGFSGCEWKWTGLKASAEGNPAQRTQSLDWSKAGDEYVRFSEADVEDGGSGIAAWLRLKIHTRSTSSRRQPKAEALVCSICLGTEDNGIGGKESKDAWTAAPCSHQAHTKCLDDWKTSQHLQGRYPDCPMCRLALH